MFASSLYIQILIKEHKIVKCMRVKFIREFSNVLFIVFYEYVNFNFYKVIA